MHHVWSSYSAGMTVISTVAWLKDYDLLPHGIGLMAFVFFFKTVIAVDTATTIFFKILQPWIQRRLGVDTATDRRGYSDGQAWIQIRPGVDTETARRGYSDGQAWILQRKLGVVSIATKLFPREKKHLDVAISTLFHGYCHVFLWQNWSLVLVKIPETVGVSAFEYRRGNLPSMLNSFQCYLLVYGNIVGASRNHFLMKFHYVPNLDRTWKQTLISSKKNTRFWGSLQTHRLEWASLWEKVWKDLSHWAWLLTKEEKSLN